MSQADSLGGSQSSLRSSPRGWAQNQASLRSGGREHRDADLDSSTRSRESHGSAPPPRMSLGVDGFRAYQVPASSPSLGAASPGPDGGSLWRSSAQSSDDRVKKERIWWSEQLFAEVQTMEKRFQDELQRMASGLREQSSFDMRSLREELDRLGAQVRQQPNGGFNEARPELPEEVAQRVAACCAASESALRSELQALRAGLDDVRRSSSEELNARFVAHQRASAEEAGTVSVHQGASQFRDELRAMEGRLGGLEAKIHDVLAGAVAEERGARRRDVDRESVRSNESSRGVGSIANGALMTGLAAAGSADRRQMEDSVLRSDISAAFGREATDLLARIRTLGVELRSELAARVDAARAELKGDVAASSAELRADIVASCKDLSTDLQKQFSASRGPQLPQGLSDRRGEAPGGQLAEVLRLVKIVTDSSDALAIRIADEAAQRRAKEQQLELRVTSVEHRLGNDRSPEEFRRLQGQLQSLADGRLTAGSVTPQEQQHHAPHPQTHLHQLQQHSVVSEDLKDTLEKLVGRVNRMLVSEDAPRSGSVTPLSVHSMGVARTPMSVSSSVRGDRESSLPPFRSRLEHPAAGSIHARGAHFGGIHAGSTSCAAAPSSLSTAPGAALGATAPAAASAAAPAAGPLPPVEGPRVHVAAGGSGPSDGPGSGPGGADDPSLAPVGGQAADVAAHLHQQQQQLRQQLQQRPTQQPPPPQQAPQEFQGPALKGEAPPQSPTMVGRGLPGGLRGAGSPRTAPGGPGPRPPSQGGALASAIQQQRQIAQQKAQLQQQQQQQQQRQQQQQLQHQQAQQVQQQPNWGACGAAALGAAVAGVGSGPTGPPAPAAPAAPPAAPPAAQLYAALRYPRARG